MPGVREIPDTILRDPVSSLLLISSRLFSCPLARICKGWGVFSYCCLVCKAIRIEAGAQEAVGEGRGGARGSRFGSPCGPGVPASGPGCITG